MPDTDLTELVALDPKRLDGVKSPASGLPFLIMKSRASKDVNAQGGIDETPDIYGAESVLVQLFKLIEAEAREGQTGAWHEVCDIDLLAEAVHLVKCFKRNEELGAGQNDGEPMMKSVSDDELSQVTTWVFKRKISAADRKKLASEGKALPDGSYPIENAEDLHNAAILARSGHGDVAAAKRLIAKRAKELGVPNPLAHDAAKETSVANNENTNPESFDAPVEKSQADLIGEAIEKATAPLQETIESLKSELAAIKATPVPGGPVITAVTARASVADTEQIARFDRLAKSTPDRELARYYAERADELRAGK